MKTRFKILTVLALASLSFLSPRAQILMDHNNYMHEDSVLRDFSNQPYFGLYKDNYFIFGPSLTHPTKQNTNVKFQISIAQRLTRATLPWGTYLYLFYTQKCFWNILEESMPMTDLNFNPGVGLTKPLFYNERYIGKLTFLIEHESNGRDGLDSRSWNRVAVAGNIFVNNNLMVHGKVWVPIVDSDNNRGISRYAGWGQFGAQMLSNNRRFIGGLTLVKRAGWNLNCNVVVDLAYRIFKGDNQYLYLQFYNGYGEGLLEYNRHHCQLRAGLLIRPKFFSDF